jgi:trk system potassium uptake protein
MKKNVLVLGLGRYGSALCVALADRGAEVVGVDRDPALVDALKSRIDHVVVADIGNSEALATLAAHIDVAVIAVGSNLEAAILAVMRLKEAGVKRVVARATNDEADRIFRKLGADDVVRPMREAAEHLAATLTSLNALDFVLLGENFAVIEYRIGPKVAGKTLQELAWRRRFHVVAIGVKRGSGVHVDGGAVDDRVFPVDPQEKLIEGDRALLVGLTRDLDAFQREG